MTPRLALALAAALAAAPIAAVAEPQGAWWRGDICHQQKGAGAAAAQGAIACLPYPPRVAAHERNCRWVATAYGGAEHEFEVCRGSDGAWRPSGRS